MADKWYEARCSFCGALEQERWRIIAGPGVYICDECVALCQEILNETRVARFVKALSQAKPGNQEEEEAI